MLATHFLSPERLITTLLCAGICTTTAFAQTVGGGYDQIHQWNGQVQSPIFGHCVSGGGDLNADGYDDIVVSNQVSSGIGVTTGSVFAYSGSDGSLLYQWDSGAPEDRHGHSVAIAGDVNGDGFDDIIIGAPGDSNATHWAFGSAFVYSGKDGSNLYHWEGSAAGDNLGWSVAGAGDVNADGFDDVIVSAPFAGLPGGLTSAGLVYVYSGNDGSLLHLFEGEDANHLLGLSASGAGDVNNDGFGDVIIGTRVPSPGGIPSAGSAYVYSGSNGNLLYQWNGTMKDEQLGVAVSGAGDLNADDFDDLIVGTGIRANVAYAYSGKDGSLMFQWDGENTLDSFGTKVSEAGDFNGDGYSDVIIGAYSSDFVHNQSGAAYIYSGNDGALIKRFDGQWLDKHFGFSVSNAGDLNGDGFADVVVGSPNSSHGLPFSGSAFTFGYSPFMESNTSTVSASSGGSIDLALNFPVEAVSNEYKILISSTGVGPTNYGIDIPLTQDSLVIETFLGIYPVPASNMHGTLDGYGNASASLTIPADLPSALVGNIYYLAAIANQPGQLPDFSSVAVQLLVVP